MDAIDRKIVALLQEDASLSLAQIAHRVGLSQSPCWKRIQRLEKSGVILKRVALISPESIGMGLTVFVSIETGDHSSAWLSKFIHQNIHQHYPPKPYDGEALAVAELEQQDTAAELVSGRGRRAAG